MAASDCGYFAISSSSVRRDAAASPSSNCDEPMLSSASGTFWLSGYCAISARCEVIAPRKSRCANCALPTQYCADGASGLFGQVLTNDWKPDVAAA